MNIQRIGWVALGLSALLMTGCGEEESSSAVPKETATSQTQKAKDAVVEAFASVKEAAAVVATKVQEKAVVAKEIMTEVSATVVEKTANKVTELASVVETAVASETSTVDGQQVYKSLCFSCHDMGIAGSPKIGDQAAWVDRIAAGTDSLYASALNGKGAMPAKGGNPGLSEAEIKAAVDYMVSKAQ